MTARKIGNLELPPLDQVGFVVRDVEATMAVYEPLFGPFTVMETELVDADYRGREVTCKLKIATGHSGTVEIELIEMVDGEGVYGEFLDAGREGPHHIRFRIDNLDEAIGEVAKEGFSPVFSKRFSPEIAFAYVEGADGMLFEFLEMP